jgi:hypothetical protein
MTIGFEDNFSKEELGTRIRAIMGVPEEILDNEVINSPTFKIKANKYINKKILDYTEEQLSQSLELLNIAYLYYVCYLLCTGMYARLPKQMENVSTKTILQTIDWDSKALEMLNKCDEIMDDLISELDENFQYGNTFAVLTDSSDYPNTNI